MKVKKSKAWSHLCHAFVTLVFCGCCPGYAIFAHEKRRQAVLVGNKNKFYSLAYTIFAAATAKIGESMAKLWQINLR